MWFSNVGLEILLLNLFLLLVDPSNTYICMYPISLVIRVIKDYNERPESSYNYIAIRIYINLHHQWMRHTNCHLNQLIITTIIQNTLRVNSESNSVIATPGYAQSLPLDIPNQLHKSYLKIINLAFTNRFLFLQTSHIYPNDHKTHCYLLNGRHSGLI